MGWHEPCNKESQVRTHSAEECVMKKLIVLAAAAGGLMALQACAVEETDTDIGSIGQQVCDQAISTRMTMAALAMAMGKELGEIDPLSQLEIVNGMLALRPGVCPGDCPQTEALLGMQVSDEYDWNTPCFSADNYRSELVAKFGEQQDRAPWPDAANDHRLVWVEDVTKDGRLYSIFEVYDPECTTAYEIKGVHSGRCLDIAWDSSDDAANLQIYDCWGGSAQQFTLEDAGDGYVLIKNVNSGKCLDVANWSGDNGANIMQYSCHGGANQQFQVVESGGKVHFINRHSGKALDIWGWGTDNGTNAAQYSYGGGDNQQFYLNPVGSGDCAYSGSLDGLSNRLWAFGNVTGNAFLDPQVDGTQWGIDPDNADTGDTSTSSGSCMPTSMCRMYDPYWDNLGGCCICNGSYGTWTVMARNPSYLYCKL
jgi:hypothetical protein